MEIKRKSCPICRNKNFKRPVELRKCLSTSITSLRRYNRTD